MDYLSSNAAELTWITYLLLNLGISPPTPLMLFCDNISALYMTESGVSCSYQTHYPWLSLSSWKGCSWLSRHSLCALSSQIADIFPKALFKDSFRTLQLKLGVLPSLSSSLRGSDKERPWVGLDSVRLSTQFRNSKSSLRNSKGTYLPNTSLRNSKSCLQPNPATCLPMLSPL